MRAQAAQEFEDARFQYNLKSGTKRLHDTLNRRLVELEKRSPSKRLPTTSGSTGRPARRNELTFAPASATRRPPSASTTARTSNSGAGRKATTPATDGSGPTTRRAFPFSFFLALAILCYRVPTRPASPSEAPTRHPLGVADQDEPAAPITEVDQDDFVCPE